MEAINPNSFRIHEAGGATPDDGRWGARDGAAGSPLTGVASSPDLGKHKVLRFTDKDEHMYFWFPLLAGLSELTFDPRSDIRSALKALNPDEALNPEPESMRSSAVHCPTHHHTAATLQRFALRQSMGAE